MLVEDSGKIQVVNGHHGGGRKGKSGGKVILLFITANGKTKVVFPDITATQFEWPQTGAAWKTKAGKTMKAPTTKTAMKNQETKKAAPIKSMTAMMK